jgi:Heterokaryon incompatibility protein (HET)
MLQSSENLYTCWQTFLSSESYELPRRSHNLGLYYTLVFRSDCPLCKLLRRIIPPPLFKPDDEVLLVPASVLERTEPNIQVSNTKYASILYAAPYQSGREKPVLWAHEASDAIFLASNPSGESVFMGGREVGQFVDLDLVSHWLRECSEHHAKICMPLRDARLDQIRLINVLSRTVVKYPKGKHCDFVCLSYVWGNISQKSCSLGPLPHNLPATIEDSIELVKALGKEFLWVDSVFHSSLERLPSFTHSCVPRSVSDRRTAATRKSKLHLWILSIKVHG